MSSHTRMTAIVEDNKPRFRGLIMSPGSPDLADLKETFLATAGMCGPENDEVDVLWDLERMAARDMEPMQSRIVMADVRSPKQKAAARKARDLASVTEAKKVRDENLWIARLHYSLVPGDAGYYKNAIEIRVFGWLADRVRYASQKPDGPGMARYGYVFKANFAEENAEGQRRCLKPEWKGEPTILPERPFRKHMVTVGALLLPDGKGSVPVIYYAREKDSFRYVSPLEYLIDQHPDRPAWQAAWEADDSPEKEDLFSFELRKLFGQKNGPTKLELRDKDFSRDVIIEARPTNGGVVVDLDFNELIGFALEDLTARDLKIDSRGRPATEVERIRNQLLFCRKRVFIRGRDPLHLVDYNWPRLKSGGGGDEGKVANAQPPQ